ATPNARLASEFNAVVYRRLKCKVQSLFTVGPIRDLVKGGCFKAAAYGQVYIEIVREFIPQGTNGQRFAVAYGSAVISIVWRKIMVVRFEVNGAVAQSGFDCPPRRKPP